MEYNYPWDESSKERPRGEGQAAPNTNTVQDVTNVNAYNEKVKDRQTNTFSPDLAASWNGSYKAKGT